MKLKVFFVLLIVTSLLSASVVFAWDEPKADYEWPENPTETYSLITATTVAGTSQCGDALLAINEQLKEESNGAVELDIFWEGTLGSSVEVGEACTTGTIDIGLVTAAVASNYVSAIDVMALPFIIRGTDHLKAIIDECFDGVTAGIEDTLGTPLGLWGFGYHHLFTRDKEVKKMEDMKGLTVRVMEGKIFADTFEALGAIPTNVALSELVTALQQGVVDGADIATVTFVNQQQYTFCNYMYAFGYNYSAGLPILTKEAEERYPEEVINLVKKVFYDNRYHAFEVGDRFDAEFMSVIEENGVAITVPDEEDFAKLREAVQPVWDKYAERIGAELIEQVSNAGL